MSDEDEVKDEAEEEVLDPKAKLKANPYMKAITWLSEEYNRVYKDLIGSLLATLEATVDDERKLEALRSRVKDIQGLAWEGMNQELYGLYMWFK